MDRHPKPGFILPSNDWYSDARGAVLSEPPQVSRGLETLVIGIFIGVVVSSSMIALGAWLF